MGFSLVMPFMAMYLVEERGARATTYGAIYLLAGAVAAASQALAGELADRVGRRVVMVTALVLRVFNLAGIGLAVLVHAPIWALGALIVSNGFLRAQFEPAASAAVTDLAPPEARVAAYGLQRMGVNLGWAIGPALGAGLALFSYGAMFFFAAPVTIFAAAAVWTVRDRRRPAEVRADPAEPRGDVLATLTGNRPFLVYLGLVFAGSIMTVQLFSTLSVFAHTELGLSRADIGLVYTVNGALVVLLQVPAVVLIERGGPRRALLVGPALYALAYLGVGFASGFTSLALAVALLTAGEVAFAPALADMAAHLGDPRRLGRAFGLFGLMQQLGLSLGPLVGGAVYDHLRHRHVVMWGAIAGGMAVVGLGYLAFTLVVLRRDRDLHRVELGAVAVDGVQRDPAAGDLAVDEVDDGL